MRAGRGEGSAFRAARGAGTRRAARGPTPLQEALAEFLRESGIGRKVRHWQVYEAWGRALGRDLARRARPVKFARGELWIEVESAAHFQELSSFTGEGLRKKANDSLGGEEIRKVVFKLKR